MNVTYGNTGTKYATVTVYSGSQSITRDCNGGVTIGSQNDNNYYSNNNNGNFEIACFADADRVRVGVPVTWGVEAVGGNGDYSYSWTGSEGLSGSQRSAVTSYGSTGTKNATVTVTSGGRSATKLCGNVVTVVSGATTGGGNTTVKTDTTNTDSTGLSAASLFSLKNVPWGWVAILVILVLFAMVMYLLFTRRETVIHESIK
jgi:tripartite-type tricarboxylate transporter receptor subunit TctC